MPGPSAAATTTTVPIAARPTSGTIVLNDLLPIAVPALELTPATAIEIEVPSVALQLILPAITLPNVTLPNVTLPALTEPLPTLPAVISPDLTPLTAPIATALSPFLIGPTPRTPPTVNGP